MVPSRRCRAPRHATDSVGRTGGDEGLVAEAVEEAGETYLLLE